MTASTQTKPIKVLLQTTIPATEDDWGIERFGLLHEYLASLKNEAGQPLFEVTARNRQVGPEGYDPILATLDESDFAEMWLFAVDTGDGLTEEEGASISSFRKHGGGLLVTRDHMDLGSSLCNLGGVGPAHYFHTKNADPDESRWAADDSFTTTISWPNYHSGANGDYQEIEVTQPAHPLLKNPASPTGLIRFFASHPHEGGVGVPAGEDNARVIARGKSQVTGHSFNLAVAFENARTEEGSIAGRAIAESSFHHFADYNWQPALGSPSFVSETPGDAIVRDPQALDDVHAYVRNVALWLAGAD